MHYFKKIHEITLIISWSLYELANHFFAVNIITLYFSRWLVIEKGVPEIFYSIAFGISVLFAAVLAPFLGFVSDYTQRPRLFLVLFTVLSVVFTFLLGLSQNVVLSLIFFAIANFGCQIAVVFYNALMVKIAPKLKIGFISGIGKMFAYCGTVMALYLLNPRLLPYGYPAIFIGTSLAFLVFALPCMIFLKDTPNPVELGSVFQKANIRQIYSTLKISLGKTYQIVGMPQFLTGSFFGLIPVNIIILFMAVYVKIVFQLNESQITHLIALGTVFAILGSVLSGYVSDFLGYRRSLIIVFVLWCLCFGLGSLLQQNFLYPLVAVTSGLALGATFVIVRAMAIEMVPADKISEAFGLFSLVGCVASVTGALFWGIMLLLLSPLGVLKYRIALFSLIPFMIVGIFYLLKIPQKKS